MKKDARLFICVATLTLVFVTAGCKSLTISVNDANPPVFSFSAGRFAECCNHLSFLMVAELPADPSDPRSGKVIWDIRPLSGTAEDLPKITYGQVPPGFEQKIPAVGPPPPLEEGKIYEASGPPVEVPDAYVRFRIQNGKVVQIPRR